MTMTGILTAVLWFLLIGGVLGVALSFAAKYLSVKEDPRIEEITEALPGANCGGCGHAGCAALAEAITKGEALPSACAVLDPDGVEKISEIMGIKVEHAKKTVAHVMCSGTCSVARKKYAYEGVHDCVAADRLAGGDKLCPNGCMGLGTCVAHCKFDAIKIIDGCAVVDRSLCRSCGVCVASCPKGLISLIPYDSVYAVACTSAELGAVTRKSCDVGCIGCKICEKNCEFEAIKVEKGHAKINYELCTSCGKCAEVCPRKIIRNTHGKPSVKIEEKIEETV
ncbi:MAG: RnfABCDGE type electron transport complex subunit B [Clostridia bacterium]|nr:RnfABCDGE type electron transport complex subunit B [Clostridia bacterium]